MEKGNISEFPVKLTTAFAFFSQIKRQKNKKNKVKRPLHGIFTVDLQDGVEASEQGLVAGTQRSGPSFFFVHRRPNTLPFVGREALSFG